MASSSRDQTVVAPMVREKRSRAPAKKTTPPHIEQLFGIWVL
jgi:hypothetical protein